MVIVSSPFNVSMYPIAVVSGVTRLFHHYLILGKANIPFRTNSFISSLLIITDLGEKRVESLPNSHAFTLE
jgi:hypothetical protein